MDHQPPAIFIQPHLGLGDMLVANAIFRHFAQTHSVIIPCKRHNVPSVHWMLRDIPSALLQVDGDLESNRLAAVAKKRAQFLGLGMFGMGTFDDKQWDKEFFRQAGIPFENRWTDWKVERDLSREFEPPNQPYAFVHEDAVRDFLIDLKRLPEMRIETPILGKTDNIFQYCRMIENATELHMIDSCFAILADSLTTLKAKRKVIHIYARKNALPPTYKQNWEILK